MKIQSLSVVVPNQKCINNCAFCVSKMHTEDYTNQKEGNDRFYDLYERDYVKRLEFARDNGCNTVVLTGNSEPQQNRGFLKIFGTLNNHLSKPFRKIDLQTTGVLLDDEYLRFLRNHVGVNTIALSMSDMFSDGNNAKINGTPEHLAVDIEHLCCEIKRYDFNLRLSLNLTDVYNNKRAEEIFRRAKELKADQLTFRELYSSGLGTPQDEWIEQHAVSSHVLEEIKQFIRQNGRPLRIMEYGQTLYSVREMSVIVDDDCMSTALKEDIKYLILRPDCKLYSNWDDKGSLVF
ncbi:MAG TPA: radical SAM protein [Candidatus Avelusimicrobium excrementipullorum]|nr:radical SAM protein [Candidatus Avelusimicrobium excrementipullorum]